MMHATDIVGYTYQADIHCPDCIVNLVAQIPRMDVGIIEASTTEGLLDAHAQALGVDRYDETSFDSDEFPKVILLVGSDLRGDEHCGTCHEPLIGS